MKSIYITFDDKDFERIKKIYAHIRKHNPKIKSWAKFFLDYINERSIISK